MFKKQLFCMTFIWVLLALGTGLFFHTSPSRAQSTYQRLMKYSDSSKKNSNKTFKAEQRRTKVSKQILFLQNNQRLQWRLQSVSSELSFDQQEKGLELIERFKNVNCIMQEKFSQENKTQFVRTLKAEEAVYHYKKEELVADQALVARYEIPGSLWLNNTASSIPMMEGKAEKIALSFKSNHLFKAQKFEASFSEVEKKQ